MSSYKCDICNFTSDLKSNWKRHLTTKKHINKEKDLGLTKIIGAKMSQNEPKMSQMSQNEPKMSQQISKEQFFCDYCDKPFSSKANKRKHELHRCDKSNVLENTNYIKMLEADKKKLFKQVESLIKKAGNTTVNTLNTNNTTNTTNTTNTSNSITLNGYGKEDLSHITYLMEWLQK